MSVSVSEEDALAVIAAEVMEGTLALGDTFTHETEEAAAEAGATVAYDAAEQAEAAAEAARDGVR